MTLDETRLMANGRAQRLFEDGYRARWNGAGLQKIRSAKGKAYSKQRACRRLVLLLRAWADLDDRTPTDSLETTCHD